MMPPAASRIITELEAGVAAMDAEIKAVDDRRAQGIAELLAMRHRIEALSRSRFVIAEQLAQLKETLATEAEPTPATAEVLA